MKVWRFYTRIWGTGIPNLVCGVICVTLGAIARDGAVQVAGFVFGGLNLIAGLFYLHDVENTRLRRRQMATPSSYRPILKNPLGFSVQRTRNGVWLNTLAYVIGDMISDGRIIITRPIKRHEVSSDGNSRRLINYTRGLHKGIHMGVSE